MHNQLTLCATDAIHLFSSNENSDWLRLCSLSRNSCTQEGTYLICPPPCARASFGKTAGTSLGRNLHLDLGRILAKAPVTRVSAATRNNGHSVPQGLLAESHTTRKMTALHI